MSVSSNALNSNVNRLADYRYQLDRNSVLNFMGYSDPEKARKPVLKIADEQLARAHAFAEPWAAAIEVPLCGIENDKIHLKHGVEQVVLHSEQLPKILRHAESVVILLASAGNAATLESKRLMDEGKMGQALAMDAVGSAMVVEAMRALTDQVSAEAQQRGYGTTLRVGPGYTGWHFGDQAILFRFFEGMANLPITMSDGIMMRPQKSLLGMVGLNPGAKNAPEIEPCRLCDLKNCSMRKAPFRGADA
ncbi:MAG: hypothetical protein R3E61_09585 [Pseudomonadales bacterium]